MAQLISRHETLRTSFVLVDSKPVQRIQSHVEMDIFKNEVDESEIPRLAAEFLQAFPMDRAPLMRMGLIRLEPERHLLMFDIHHIISDGISMKNMVREFMELYSDLELPALNIQYKDYSMWQNSAAMQRKLISNEAFWLEQFTPIPEAMNLPLDFPRPEEQDNNGGIYLFQCGSTESEVLRNLCNIETATMFMVLLAICNILFSKLCGQEDITIGSVVAGRPHADLEHVMGVFVNTVAMRHFPKGDLSYRQFLAQLKERHLKIIQHQDYMFEDLVAKVVTGRALGRNPLFDVAFGVQDIHIPGLQLPGLSLKPYVIDEAVSKFDICWYCTDDGNCINYSIEYRRRLFKPETIERFAEYFNEITRMVVRNPDIRLKDIVIFHDLFDLELDMIVQDGKNFGF